LCDNTKYKLIETTNCKVNSEAKWASEPPLTFDSCNILEWLLCDSLLFEYLRRIWR